MISEFVFMENETDSIYYGAFSVAIFSGEDDETFIERTAERFSKEFVILFRYRTNLHNCTCPERRKSLPSHQGNISHLLIDPI